MGFSPTLLLIFSTIASITLAQNSPHDFLAAHNSVRAAVGVAPVSWDPAVAAYAESYANDRSDDCKLVHLAVPYGENIFWGIGANFTATDAVKTWADEKRFYDYSTNTCDSGQTCGHYTQVVWANSTNIGCARVTCKNGGTYIVCDYNPRGNIAGQRPYPTKKISDISPTLSPRSSPTIALGGKKTITGKVLRVAIPLAIALVLFLAIGICFWKKRSSKKTIGLAKLEEIQSVDSLYFSLSTLKVATSNFSNENKLGRGGFGTVYKGTLPDGRVIAVKRLSTNSKQGLRELENELLLVAKLQHKNLVRLRGVCLEEEEKLLVYEYVPNRSLDTFLFDPIKCKELNWDRRFNIIKGIARGLLYLHEESHLKVVHRDLKASNVLLDSEMNPKISDFGLARLFEEDETQGTTNRVVGTFGYMAPEYALRGRVSIKLDVYSFGVLVSEIVTGRKNSSFDDSDHATDLLSHTWEHWSRGAILDIMDPSLGEHCSIQDVSRCIQIGLLCAQEAPADRPTMSLVVLMLNSPSVALQVPLRPTFFSRMIESSNQCNLGIIDLAGKSSNEVTMSELEPR